MTCDVCDAVIPDKTHHAVVSLQRESRRGDKVTVSDADEVMVVCEGHAPSPESLRATLTRDPVLRHQGVTL